MRSRYVTERLAAWGSPKRRYRKMTREKAIEIRRAYLAREAKQQELADRYGISQGNVSRIVSGKVWAS